MTGVPDPHRSRVVLIGTSRYETLAPLPSVEENLVALAEVLCAIPVWGLPNEHVAIVADPAAPADMLDPVVRAADDATDTMVLYYAGHGLIDPRRGDLYLALVGSDPQRIYTAVPYDHVRDALLASRAARRIVILDCCYSGRALGSMADPVTKAVDEASAEGTYILAATAENKQALAPPGEPHTAFTAELLDILRSGIPGAGALLDLDTIYHHVRAAMRAKAHPIPQKRDRNTAGRLTLIHNQAHQSVGGSFAPKEALSLIAPQRPPTPTEPAPVVSPEREPGPEGADTRALEREFHAAMVEVYKRAKQEAGYTATYFVQMVSERGGLETARHLLHAPKVSEGFTALWERGRLDLSVEAVVLEERFEPLFTDEEREGACSRLEEYGYSSPSAGPNTGMQAQLLHRDPRNVTDALGVIAGPEPNARGKALIRQDAPSQQTTGTSDLPGAPTDDNSLRPGQVLAAGRSLISPSGAYRFIFQRDGNLVLYRTRDNAAFWDWESGGNLNGVCIMQDDGNLAIYDADGQTIRSSGTSGNPGSYLVVQDDANVVIYRPDGTPTWDTKRGLL